MSTQRIWVDPLGWVPRRPSVLPIEGAVSCIPVACTESSEAEASLQWILGFKKASSGSLLSRAGVCWMYTVVAFIGHGDIIHPSYTHTVAGKA